MATILTSCLEREGQGGHRCIACRIFEEAVQQNASRVRNKKRGDTGKLYKCTKKIYMAASPSILHRRNSYSVRGREACLGSAAAAAIPAVPCDGTPKRNRRSKHSPTHTYKVPTSDEFKKKKHRMCEHHEKEQDEQQSAQKPLNLQEKQYAQILTSNPRAGSPITTDPLHPDAPDPIGTTTLKPPTDEVMEFSVSIDPSLVTGAACFNDTVRQQLANAQEEVKRLLDANRFLLTVNSGDANMYANMYEHVLQGKDKRATEQADAFQALEEMVRAERNSFRLRIDGLTDNLQICEAKLRRANRHLQNRYTRQATMSDLASEYNTYGKRKWSQIATEIWDIPQVQKVLMKKAKAKYQQESYSCVKIACAIDSGRGCNLSGYQNIVNVERGKNKRRQCLLRSSSTIRNTMEVAEEMMVLKVPWKIIQGSKGQIHDGFSFDTKALFIHLVKSFGLEGKAKQGELEMAITIDGAKLDAKINHVTWGFKLTDKDSRCPITGMLIYSELKNMQSDSWSFPGTTLFEDDNSKTYEQSFCDQFAFVRLLRTEGIPELGWLPCKVAEPSDMKAHQIVLGRGGAAKRHRLFCHCCSKRSIEIDEENVCPCGMCLLSGHQCLHARVVDDHYYTSCQYEKQSIIDRCPTMIRTLEAELPGLASDFCYLAVDSDSRSCGDGWGCDEFDNQPCKDVVLLDDDELSAVSAVTDSGFGCEATPACCDSLLERMPLKLMPLRKAYRADCIHHKRFVTDKYKKDILECMSLFSMPKLGKWQLLKQAVCDRLTLLDSYAKDAAESECDDKSEQATIIHDDDLLCAVKHHMDGELNWKAVRQMCMYSAGMDVGTDDDATSRRKYRSSRTKLLSSLRILGMDKDTAHWEERRRMVADALAVIHHFKHVLYIVEYGEKYLDGDTLSRVENCIPCLLHCKKRVIDKVVRMFLLKAQEQSAKNSKKAGLDRVLELEQIINTHAMGKPGNPGRYSIPVDEKEGTILDIKMDGNTSQRLLSKFDKTLIDLLMNEDESGCDNLERESWYQVFGHLQNMFETMSQHEDFTDEELDVLQVCFDDFSDLWITLCGRDGISNYIHLIITGHLMYYLRKWRNFYRYENEGWEHLNSSIAYFYFNRTQRGGSAGTLSCEASQKVRPIGLWFLRRLFWATDRAELTEEVRLKIGREIRKKKKMEQLVNELATVPKVEEMKEESESSYSDTDEEEEEDATESEFENTLPI
jgi:hypothetical protein